MLPVIYKFVFLTAASQAVLYVAAIALIAYAAWTGWRTAATTKARLQRALGHGAMGVGVALVGLYFALPAGAFLGKRGEGIPIHTYGILLAAAFFAAVGLASRLAEREWVSPSGLVREGAKLISPEGELKRDQVLDLAFWVFLGGIGGSKVLYIVVNWKDYADATLWELLSGGLVFYGGFIGAAVAAFVWSRKNGMNFLRLADVAVPTVSLGQCLGRIGCFAAGCCWGDVAPRGFALGVHFPGPGLVKNLFGGPGAVPSSAYQSQYEDKRWVLEHTGEMFDAPVAGAARVSEWVASHGYTLPLHPTQLYESVGQLAIFFLLIALRGSRRFHGQVFALWLMLYAALRTSVELFRGDLERGTLHGLVPSIPTSAWYNLSTSQIISLCMFALGATLLYRGIRQFAPMPTAGPKSASL